MIDLNDGISIVKTARNMIEAEASGGQIDIRQNRHEKSGVFVTINTYPDGHLRGCIGYAEPVFSLSEALYRSAVSACHDPRFPALRENELENITVEVTILSKPALIPGSKDEVKASIVIGRDGLILDSPKGRGLLLPQVPTEWNWDVIEYLENLSCKAGLSKDAWKDNGSRIYSFTGEIFSETSPKGEIVRR